MLGCMAVLAGLASCGGSGGSASSEGSVQQLSLTLSSASSTENVVSSSAPSAGLTVTQTLNLSATATGGSQIHWSVSPTTGNGKFSSTTTASGATTTFTAPSTAGVYTITATSAANSAEQARIQVGVTDLAGVFTYHNDNARDGANTREYALTPANVNTKTFGKLFSCATDGAIYSQPLWAANLTINGAKHNVVLVTTGNDSIYAFDADASPCVQLWSANLLDTGHGATTNEKPVPAGKSGYLVGLGHGNMAPTVGITGTPVLDTATGIVYAVSKSYSTTGGTVFYQRLHAIDIATGQEKSGSPILIQGTYPGTGDGASTVAFDPQYEFQRSGLAMASNGTVYVTWAAHEDAPPYYGWIMGYQYRATTGLKQTVVFNTAPNVQYGGIWMSGGAPAIDSGGYLYAITGNGGFDATSGTTANNDYGDSLLKLSSSASTLPTAALTVAQYFTPSGVSSRIANDIDFGSGGAAVLADFNSGTPSTPVHLIIGGGKDHTLYLLNRDNLGGYAQEDNSNLHAWQTIQAEVGIFTTIVYWNNTIYLSGHVPYSYALDTSLNPAQFTVQASGTPLDTVAGGSTGTESLSANGNGSGILWGLDWSNGNAGATVLRAYDASTLFELWNSSLSSSDAAGNGIHFVLPTVANGKVYVGTRGNDPGGDTVTGTIPGELDVYGLKPPASAD